MASTRSNNKTKQRWSRLDEKRAGGIGKGPQKNPTKGTQNPFTQNLKVKPESTEEERASGCGWVLRCSWDNGF